MNSRTATCRCGQLSATASGEPVRVSVCHCLACKRRTGSAFSAQARWPADQVRIEGLSKTYKRTAASGNVATYHFCADCGATVHFMTGNFDGLIAIPVGAFADPAFPPPTFSVWEQYKHPWVEIRGEDVEHSD